MTEETITLLRELSAVVEDSADNATALLLERFNDPVSSLSIIYHLRLLASAWLAANPDEYAGFIPDGLGVLGYRKNCLEVVNTEIEHLGMTLLIDVLIKPIGITVEIVMLDRSEGSQANSHIFQSEDSRGMPTNTGGPMIHLLYRPSHYDILYKDAVPISDHQIKSEMSQYSNIQVNRAHSLPLQQHHNSASDLGQFSSIDISNSPLLDLPGFSMPLLPHSHSYTSQYQTLDTSYTHSPISSSMSPVLPNSTQDRITTGNLILVIKTTFPCTHHTCHLRRSILTTPTRRL
jgi:ubiquitin thioesterase protein OTUB1